MIKNHSLIRIENLRCEYRESPLGIESLNPLLSWEFQSDSRGTKVDIVQILQLSLFYSL